MRTPHHEQKDERHWEMELGFAESDSSLGRSHAECQPMSGPTRPLIIGRGSCNVVMLRMRSVYPKAGRCAQRESAIGSGRKAYTAISLRRAMVMENII
jgi:hypothetical protein